jgi:peptide deformylase
MDDVKTNRFTARLSNKDLELRLFPDAILRNNAKPVRTFDQALQSFADQMFAFMKANRGIGIAAPQVGVLYRVIAVDVEDVDKLLVNPEILSSSSDSQTEIEGCLSLPEQWFDVDRFFKVEVRAWSPEGRVLYFEVNGLSARVLQHEIDHLNGLLICDKGLEVYH